ncbi:MAG: RidA family protein [Fimbriimonas sp.]
MTRTKVSTAHAPAAIGPYSQGIQAEGRFLFLSGQTPLRPDGTIVTGAIADQATQCLENLKAVLAEAGLTTENIVKSTIFLSSMAHFAEVNAVYKTYFQGDPPARSTVAVAGLPLGVDVEIEAIAVY